MQAAWHGEHTGRLVCHHYPRVGIEYHVVGGSHPLLVLLRLDVHALEHVRKDRAALAQTRPIVVTVVANLLCWRIAPPKFGDAKRLQLVIECVLQQFWRTTLARARWRNGRGLQGGVGLVECGKHVNQVASLAFATVHHKQSENALLKCLAHGFSTGFQRRYFAL